MTAHTSVTTACRHLIAAFGFLLVGAVSLVLSSATANAQGVPGIGVCKGALEPSLVNGCAGITDVGCCDVQGRALWCEGNDLYCLDCGDGFDFCGWSDFGYYGCGEAQGSSDPSGNFPATCGECPAECDGDAACSDACRGACGTCDDGVCLESGSCYVPDCDGKECGVDAMGFSCGSCAGDEICLDGLDICGTLGDECVPGIDPGCPGCATESCVCDAYPECCTEAWDIFCVNAAQNECGADCSGCPPDPTCDGLECGEWCGLDCGGCADGSSCVDFQCCAPECDGKVCGPDGCGGTCGSCVGTDECDPAGQCIPCQPKCDGKVCGNDGCGGSCGECSADEACIGGQCSASGCPGGLTFEGCCDGNTTSWCDNGNVQSQNCGDQGCGWDSQNNWYFCGNDGEVDPSGDFAFACPGACQPDCAGKLCGDDGCGGSCGDCPDFGSCQPDGSCAACVPACDGKACGDDSCGGSCGDCLGDDEVCTADGQCEVCVPDCDGKTCGDDGCGGQCGTCEGDGAQCVEDTWCVVGCGGLTYEGCCSPLGNVYWCEDDELRGVDCSQQGGGGPGGGGQSCGWANNQGYYWCGADGEDPSGTFALACDFGPCEPDCEGSVCGGDGCGGSCGTCEDDELCESGACVVCEPDCEGKDCGDDGCGGQCGTCSDEEQCVSGQCSEDGCGGVTFEGCCDGNEAAWCEEGVLQGQSCDNGCGWVSQGGFYDCNGEGSDPSGEHELACPGACAPDCDGKSCGDDGCGGDCGSCEDGVACSDEGQCLGCVPSCDGVECGDDGCGGICGICAGESECINGACREGCDGLDARGCCDGNTAVWCRDGELRTQNCGTATCGWLYGGNEHYDCGGEGPDPSGEVPLECTFDCVTNCDGLECGDDGCGGVCGVCGDDESCDSGSCVSAPVEDDPDAGGTDGPDGLGGDDVTTIDGGGNNGGGCDCDAGPGVPSAMWLLLGLGGWLMSRRRRC